MSASSPKVFILAGQSKKQGHVKVSTFDSLANDPKTAPILREMRNADGTPQMREKVWISSIGNALAEAIVKLQTIQPKEKQ